MHFPTRRAVLGAASAVTAAGPDRLRRQRRRRQRRLRRSTRPARSTSPSGQAAGGSTDLIARAVAEGVAEDLGAPCPWSTSRAPTAPSPRKEVAGKPADGQNLAAAQRLPDHHHPAGRGRGRGRSTSTTSTSSRACRRTTTCWSPAQSSGFKTIEDLTRAGRNITFGTTGVGTGSQLAQTRAVQAGQHQGHRRSVRLRQARPDRRPRQPGGGRHHPARRGHAADRGRQGRRRCSSSRSERNQFLPDVPTRQGAGYDVPVAQYRAVAAPKGTPEGGQGQAASPPSRTPSSPTPTRSSTRRTC